MRVMSKSETTHLLRRRRITEFRRRGPIYNWLRAHHAAIRMLMQTGEGTWPRLCAEMVRHGVIARGGRAPSIKAASKAWQTVCRDLARLEVAATPTRPGSVYPSRIPKDWKPSGFRDAPHVAAKPPAGGASTPAAGSHARVGTNASVAAIAVQGTFVDPEDPPEVQQMYLDIEAQLRRADRYLGPPIKKRSE